MSAPASRVTPIRRAIILLALASIALLGMAALKRATPYGLGLTNDSAAYLGGAQALLRGEDFSRTTAVGEIRPIVHFPPAYSALLATAGAVGLDLLTASRVLGLLLFGASTLLFAVVCHQLTRSWGWALVGAALFAASAAMIEVYSFALSEPLYLAMSLATFACLGEFFRRGRRSWLILGSVAAGIAVLARYIGLSLVLAASLALILTPPPGRSRRGADLAAFVGVSLIPWLAWSVRNVLTAGTASNRLLVWHPVSWEKVSAGLAQLSTWALPTSATGEAVPGGSPLAMLSWAIVLGSIVWLAARLVLRRRNGEPDESLARLLALFLAAYLAGLVISISLFDASTPLDLRVLSPVVVTVLALAVAGLGWLARSPRRFIRWTAFGLGAVAVAASILHADSAVRRLEVDGQGFASLSWSNSRALAAVGELPEQVVVYSNRPAALLLLLDRASFITPTPTDPSTLRPRENFQEDLDRMRERIESGQAVLALFQFAEMTDPADVDWVHRLIDGLPIYAEFNDGTLFGKP